MVIAQMSNSELIFIKIFIMNKAFALICYHLGLWGILGFLTTLLLGFLACCMNLPENLFFTALGIFSIVAITTTTVCVMRRCKK